MNFNWFDTVVGPGGVPFGCYLQAGVGGSTLVGEGDPGHRQHYLAGKWRSGSETITMQKQSIVPVPTIYGAKPYYGAGAIQCLAYGANSSDAVAAGQAAPVPLVGQTITGGPETVLGSIDIWAPSQAGGTLSFNANDSYVVAGSGNPPNNYDCSFVVESGRSSSFLRQFVGYARFRIC